MAKSAEIKIPAELFAPAESSHFSGSLELPELTVGPDSYGFKNPLDWAVDVTNTGSALLVQGTVEGEGETACSRCLESVTFPLTGSIEGFFLLKPDDMVDFQEDEDAPGEDEFDLLPADHIIDLEPLIKAALMLEMPNLPLCQDDCQGLCPICGINRNQQSCDCTKDEALEVFDRAANPFSVLADLDFSDN